MYNRLICILVAGMLVLALAVGCTWVRTKPGAEAVQLLSGQDVRSCERLGQTTTSVRDRVAGMQRRPGKVEEELASLARNSAHEIGGNAIVVDSPVRDGEQRFVIYRCPD